MYDGGNSRKCGKRTLPGRRGASERLATGPQTERHAQQSKSVAPGAESAARRGGECSDADRRITYTRTASGTRRSLQPSRVCGTWWKGFAAAVS